MPHQCMNCGSVYPDEAEELMHGCSHCNSTLFLFTKDADPQDTDTLHEERDAVLEEIDAFLANVANTEDSHSHSIVFDLESIKIEEDGVYAINLRRLLEKLPLIVELKEGAYHIHLPSAFTQGEVSRFDVSTLEEKEEK